MIKNIIFDWVGCLSNDLVRTYETTMYVFEKFDLDKISPDEFKESFVLPYMDFYRKFTDRPKEEIDNLFMEGLVLSEEPELFPSTKGILDYLKNKGIKMALFSSHPQDVLLEEVERFGL
ncbi:MAG: HAD hydrolase-like protein, partial [Candidatus Aenigmarchaeota archaeon]|nr:HAD hydrolase-like protein [Candidatus Aenigmarchaeota archaeon]